MSKYATLIAQIAANIKRNGAQEITGDLLQEQLLAMITSLGEFYQFGGLAIPSTEFTPGDEPVVFIAATPGTYTNFGGLVVADGEVALLVWSGSAWSKQTTDIATRSEVSQLGQSLQSNIDNITGVNNNPIDLSLYPEKDYYLGNNDIWRASANYGLKIIPIYSLQGGSITIKANDNTEFAFLKQDNLVDGNTADICDGTTKRYCSPNSTTTATIPDDCNYVYIYTRSGSIDKSPQSVTITKKGMLYTSVIKTDADINIQSETLNDILRIFDKDVNVVVYDNLKPYSGWIGENGYEAVGLLTRLHKVVAIKGGASVIINSPFAVSFYVVKSYTEPTTSGQSPDFASGETGRRVTTPNKEYSFIAPSDANYLVIGYRYDNTIFTINNILINGYDVTKSLKYNLISLSSSSISNFDGNVDINGKTLNEIIEKQNADSECTTYNNLKEHSGWIGESHYEAVGSPNRTHKVVPIKGNSLIAIKSTGTPSFYFVKSYTEPQSNVAPDWATGETERHVLVANKTHFFISPIDAKFMVIGYRYDSTIFELNTLNVGGYDILTSALSNIQRAELLGNTYEGEKITIGNRYKTSAFPYINNSNNYHQGVAIYGNYMFVAGNDGETDVPMYIVDLTKYQVVATINIPYGGNTKPHPNTMCFGNEFAEGNTEFPLLYITQYYAKGCLVYNIEHSENNWSLSLVQVIMPDVSSIGSNIFGAGDVVAWVVDTDNNDIYSFVFTKDQPYYENNGNSQSVCKFKLPKLSDGASVEFADEDLLDNYKLEHFTYGQDMCYNQGKIYSVSGGGSSMPDTNVIRVVDLQLKAVVSRVKLPNQVWEPEGLEIWMNKLAMFGNKIAGTMFNFD